MSLYKGSEKISPVQSYVKEVPVPVPVPVVENMYEKDINFYDYNGDFLYAYTFEEVADSGFSMPTPPRHMDDLGFNSTGWNYTLSDVKASTHRLDVGAVYTIERGESKSTVIKMSKKKGNGIYLYFIQSVANGVTVDWGDGYTSQSSTVGETYLSHIYTGPDDDFHIRTVTMTPEDDCTLTLGTVSQSLFGDISTTTAQTTMQASEIYFGKCNLRGNTLLKQIRLNKIEFSKYIDYFPSFSKARVDTLMIPKGMNVTANSLDFGFKNIIISDGVTIFGENSSSTIRIGVNQKIQCIVFPKSLTKINVKFESTYGLKIISLPDSTSGTYGTTAGTLFFTNCYGLQGVILGDGMSVNNNDFTNCTSLRYLRLGARPGAQFAHGAFTNCVSLKELEIGVEDTAGFAPTITKDLFVESGIEKIIIGKHIFSLGWGLTTSAPFLKIVKILEHDEEYIASSYPWMSEDCVLRYIDFTDYTFVPYPEDPATFFRFLPHVTKIVVKDTLLNEWKNHESWASVSTQIIPESEYNGGNN